jgi:hypothetical protein
MKELLLGVCVNHRRDSGSRALVAVMRAQLQPGIELLQHVDRAQVVAHQHQLVVVPCYR